ncbi:MAG: hypothetical protein QE269_11215 [Fimbriimonas sp.]|nr:hypothetical protein [Fimbriimonas sp.]
MKWRFQPNGYAATIREFWLKGGKSHPPGKCETSCNGTSSAD